MAGENRLLVIVVAQATGAGLQTINTPTVGGSSTGVTQRDSTRDGPTNVFRSAIYTLVAPPLGSQACAVTFGGTVDELGIAVVCLNGVSQANPVRNASGSTGATASPVVSMANAAKNDFVVGAVNCWGTTLSEGTEQARIVATLGIGGQQNLGLARRIAEAAAVDFAWTETGGSGNEYTAHILAFIDAEIMGRSKFSPVLMDSGDGDFPAELDIRAWF
jgi:hypothetical protein